MTNRYLDELITEYKKISKEYPVEYGDWAEPYSEQLAKVYKEGDIVNKPVSDRAIKEAEDRLNIKLPPSYVEFLKYSNGLLLPDKFTNLLPVENIDWFYTLNKEWADIWQEGAEGYEETNDEEYFVYGKEQDSCRIRERYLKTALQISDTLEGDVLLLNPKVKFKEEWEAWWFGNKLPGAIRFKSFGELLEYLLEPSEESEPISEEERQKMIKESQKALEDIQTKALASAVSSMLSNGLDNQDILNEFQKELDIIRTENKELYDRANKNLGSEKIEDNVKLMQKVNDLLDKDIP